MSLCKHCTLKSICCVFKDTKEHYSDIDIEIKSCKYFNTIEATETPKQRSIMDPITRMLNRPDISELSNKLSKEKIENKKKEQKEKPKAKIIAEPIALDHKCVTCGGSTYKEDVANCEECGKTICSCCATYDSESGKMLCSECWAKA